MHRANVTTETLHQAFKLGDPILEFAVDATFTSVPRSLLARTWIAVQIGPGALPARICAVTFDLLSLAGLAG